MTVLLLILGVVLFVGLVVAHEWGHFIAARRNGIEVEEFGIGFPPKVWSKKIKTSKSKFLFTINILPLGGFVRLKGENDSATAPGTFGAASMKAKTKVMLAGVGMNLLIALLMLTFIALIGMPKLIDNQFTVASDTKITREVKVFADQVIASEPAAKAGVQTGDRIISLDGKKINQVGQVGDLAKENPGKTVTLTVERNDQQKNLQVTLNKENKGNGYLGVATSQEGIQLQRSTWSAPVVAVGLTGQLTELTFKGLGTAISSLSKGDTSTVNQFFPLLCERLLDCSEEIHNKQSAAIECRNRQDIHDGKRQ